MRPITEIIIHCTATEEGKDYKADDIRRWHTLPPPRGNGWKDIGYHYVIDIDGTIEPGRPLDQIGAHCKGHNQNTVGICYVGGKRNGKAADTRNGHQDFSLRCVIKWLKAKYPTITKVSGHRDYSDKACPCFDAHIYQILVE